MRSLVGRHGTLPDDLAAVLAACADARRLQDVIVDLASAADLEAAIALVASLRARAPSPR